MASGTERILFLPNFEIETKIINGRERKTLHVFYDDDQKLCYTYYFFAHENVFKCLGCFGNRKAVSARIYQNSNGEDYVLLTNDKHVCAPRIYVPQKEITYQWWLTDDEFHKRKQLLQRLTDEKNTFLSNVRLNQKWSLPDSIIYCMAKNPSSAISYQNLTESCKYFFIKNPIIVVENLTYYGKAKWQAHSCKKLFTFDDFKRKLWITGNITIDPKDNPTLASSVIPKLYRCDPDNLWIVNQILSFNDFCFLASTATTIKFFNVDIMDNGDGTIVPLEKLFNKLLNVKSITIESNQMFKNVSYSTFKELIKVPQFKKLEYFWMNCIPEDYDIDAFYAYTKKNKLTKFYLEFDASISEFYKNHLDRIIDEISLMKNYYYKAPIIKFRGLEPEKYAMLVKL